jgi:hypothetical protein
VLLPLEVIWIPDQTIKPPGPKMAVCVEPDAGYFFRINSEPKWQKPILLKQSENTFLLHDSYLECGAPLDLDEYVISESLRDRGIIGRVNDNVIGPIITALEAAYSVSPEDREMICKVLRTI